VGDAASTVTRRLLGALSPENVGQVLTRSIRVSGDETASADGTPVVRTLRWMRAA
jgi:hypothetical protein